MAPLSDFFTYLCFKSFVMESQNTEYKSAWRDEYLKWICGFANAQGGTLFIGIDIIKKVFQNGDKLAITRV